MIELPLISPEEKKRKPSWLRVKLPVGPEYAKVRRLKLELLVVDDGSSDGTAPLVRRMMKKHKAVRLQSPFCRP